MTQYFNCISEKSGEIWADAYYHYDAKSSVLESLDQDAYGNVKVGSQAGYHLTTKEYDSMPELYYFWQRWYDPIIGLFIKISPFPSNLEHQYGFTKNNPLLYIDPYGLVPTDIKDLLEWWLTLYSQGSSLKNNSAIKCRNLARCLRHKWASGITVTCMDIEVFCKCMFDSVTTSGWFGTLPLYTLESQCSWVADQVLHNGKPICQGGIRY